MNGYTFWLKGSAVTMLLTAAIHTTSFFVEPAPTNDTERQIFSLVQEYRFNLGGGIHRSLGDLMTGLSMCFTLLYLLGGVLILYLLRAKVDRAVMRGLTTIMLIVFGFAFAWMALYTFLPPIILTGLVLVLLIAARLIGSGKAEEEK